MAFQNGSISFHVKYEIKRGEYDTGKKILIPGCKVEVIQPVGLFQITNSNAWVMNNSYTPVINHYKKQHS